MSSKAFPSARSIRAWERSWLRGSLRLFSDLLEAKSEILKLWAQLRRTDEVRDILKKAAGYFAKYPD